MNAYVVWMETTDNRIRKIGQLKTSSGLFSKTLKSSLTTVSVVEPRRFFITAEKDGNIDSPGSTIVLTTKD
jgi:hypothetical protein